MTYEEYSKKKLEVLELVKDRKNWKASLFETCKELCGWYPNEPCIFRLIRKQLSEYEYMLFDKAYCEHGRPGWWDAYSKGGELLRARQDYLKQMKERLVQQASKK